MLFWTTSGSVVNIRSALVTINMTETWYIAADVNAICMLTESWTRSWLCWLGHDSVRCERRLRECQHFSLLHVRWYAVLHRFVSIKCTTQLYLPLIMDVTWSSSNSNPVSYWVTWQTNRELYTRTGQTVFTIFCFQKMFKITKLVPQCYIMSVEHY